MSAQESDYKRVFDIQGANLPILRRASAAARLAKLAKLRDVILAHFPEAVAALASDLGKPPFEAAIDIGATFSEIAEVEQGLAQWMQPEPVDLGSSAPASAKGYIVRQPRGRVIIFGPWNFPFGLLFQPLVAAIAAGNSVILKPSEMTPQTSALSRKIVSEVFDENEVAVFEGGPDVANALLQLPFDHIFFTGSTSVGRQVMAAAARHLSSVTLELGGKCPVIIDAGADVLRAAQWVAGGKFLNAGQICLAPDHVWLHEEQVGPFVAEISGYVEGSYRADGAFNTQDFARIVNERQFDRIVGLIDDAKARGARVVLGGRNVRDQLLIEPTILVDVAHDSLIMQEEIFGPVLPILVYSDLEVLLGGLRRSPKPLALYAFSERQEFVERIVAETDSGGVTINGILQHASSMALPFGGVGASGNGRYHGKYSFLELSHSRAVFEQPSGSPSALPAPPYGDLMPF